MMVYVRTVGGSPFLFPPKLFPFSLCFPSLFVLVHSFLSSLFSRYDGCYETYFHNSSTVPVLHLGRVVGDKDQTKEKGEWLGLVFCVFTRGASELKLKQT